jgi:hypothetical protein
VKGDNITIVLDCCYSGGGARAESAIAIQARYALPIHLLEKLLFAAENNPRKRWAAGSIMTQHWRPDVSSYVVLAACQDFERVWECNDKGGEFTIALLEALRSLPLHTSTYRDLIGRIGGLPCQRPCAVGYHVDKFIFNHRQGPQYKYLRLPGACRWFTG